MPELPEVEISRANLELWLAGRELKDVSVFDKRVSGKQSKECIQAALVGATVKCVTRRGKFLLFELIPNRPRVVAHLGMTGRFTRVNTDQETPKYTRVVLKLSCGTRIIFSDPRRLGAFRLLDDREKSRLNALGVEPLSQKFTSSHLEKLSRRSRRPIKTLLMDQTQIAGIGNIHATEALFLAKIHPGRRSSSLNRTEIQKLFRAIRKQLRQEINRSRSENLLYLQQTRINPFLVYGRSNQPCSDCGAKITRFVQNSRSSYYCPSCQPEE